MILEVNDASLVFENGDLKHTVLSGLSFGVAEGEFISIVGPSGCGKTSILRLIVGILAPTSGSIKCRPGGSEENPFGMVFQEPVLLPWRSAAQNVGLPLEVIGCPILQVPEMVADALRQVELENFADYLPRQLSGGMQQRVAIARALVTKPEFLIMDEPFSALDTLTREFLNQELQRIWMETRKTVVFVTHSISEAIFLSDRVIVMAANPGRVREIVVVDLPRPRREETRDEPAFFEYSRRIRRVLQAKGA